MKKINGSVIQDGFFAMKTAKGLQPFSYYYMLFSRENCPPEVIFLAALYH